MEISCFDRYEKYGKLMEDMQKNLLGIMRLQARTPWTAAVVLLQPAETAVNNDKNLDGLQCEPSGGQNEQKKAS